MGLLSHGEPIRHLEVAVAAQRRQQRRVVAVEVRVVDRPPLQAQRTPLALDGQVQLLGQAAADQSRSAQNQLTVAGETALTPRRVLGVAAVSQRPPLAAWAGREMHMMLLAPLQLLHVLRQVSPRPLLGPQPAACLVGRPAQHQGAVLVLRPLFLDGGPIALPALRVAVDGAPDVGSVGGVGLHQSLDLGLPQVKEAGQRPVLMAALDEHLHVGVEGSTLLTLDGAKHRVNSAQHAAAGHGVAPEGVAARLPRSRAVRAARAEPDPQEVAQRQEHERPGAGSRSNAVSPPPPFCAESPEALRASQRVPGQQRAPVLVVRQVLRQGLGAQPAELFVQRRRAAGLELLRAIPQ